MKSRILVSILAVMVAGAAQATLFSYTYSSNFDPGSGAIPDGNVAGWADTRSISAGDFALGDGTTTEIRDVDVRLHISGTYNGDLYGYLVHSSGFVVLLNRVGRDTGTPFGDGGAGMNITLSDQTGTDVHLASGALSGTYNPDGRTADPALVVNADGRQNGGNPLGLFNTLDADGAWTLFLADMSGGDISTVVSWGLDIEVVPEPITWALALFGGVLGAVKLGHNWRRRK